MGEMCPSELIVSCLEAGVCMETLVSITLVTHIHTLIGWANFFGIFLIFMRRLSWPLLELLH